ncbi:MAG: hypothetical protein LQ347_002338 [Umbilicaria vellea]|nr:MAG: hypothetical protein LQ347_002338 [Umbilicaria vellea]
MKQLGKEEANSRLATKRDDDDRLPIHWAVSYNQLETVRLLISLKSFDPDTQDGSGWTPLMMAASLKEGDELVDLLLNKGADQNFEVARKLIAYKASARVKDKRGQLALHRAAAIGSVPLVKLLLDNKSPLNATDSSGYSALHHAIAEGHGDTAIFIIKAGAETDRKDANGNLAIDLAPDTKIRKFIAQSAEREGIDMA